MKKIIGWTFAIVVIIGAVVGFDKWQQERMIEPHPQSVPSIDVPRPAAPTVEPMTHYPISQSADTGAVRNPLPSLQDSDHELVTALSALLGRKTVISYFYPGKIVRHIVATIDNLPRHSVSVQVIPVKPVGGNFLTTGEGKNLSIAPDNAARYAPYVHLMEMADTKKLVALYVHFYPLFQQAYQDLGYPDGYFNDRLIAVIDHLLAAPEYREPVQLVQPKVFYQYADQELESTSAGRKMLIRIGAENAAKVKAKLRAIRKELTNADLK